jgi:hypothetical protein
MFDEKCWGSSDVFIGNLLHENLVIEKIILLIRPKKKRLWGKKDKWRVQ